MNSSGGGRALEAVARVSEGVPPAEALEAGAAEAGAAQAWVAFDIAVRARARPPWFLPPTEQPRWPRLSALFGPRPAPPPPRPPALALCDPDGRVREAALKGFDAGPELHPLLVVRCADWVEPVRERARALLGGLSAGELLPHSELILRLSRRAQGDFARALLEGTLREGPGADVVALLAHPDRATYRLAYRIAVERGLLTPTELATAAATCGDVTLQDLCAEAAVAAVPERAEGRKDASGKAARAGGRAEETGPAGDGAAVLDRLLTARAPRVRAAGVTALRRAGLHREAEPFLADRSAVVRACARYVLRQGGIDPLPRYRALCAEPGAHPGAAAGLGECGDRATDAGTLWALVEHPLPAVRLHAITGLRALDAVARERLTPSLDDPSPAVVRAATRALLPDAARIPEALLRERTAPGRPRAVRVAAARLLRAAGLVG
ncbi:hypothetical protein [Streptomyces sp. NPDC088755]|uniref:hypothetical protein n=1 Tax=Streptomyces sp. NPDC088755 TaxID=3365888 RepID=UPI003806CACD